ncbi:MAG: hypothetical protein ACYC61_06615 [Isosphaeraceae bacterium]
MRKSAVGLAGWALILAALAGPASGTAPPDEEPPRDVEDRARAIGTDKPQDEPARAIVAHPERARLKFPGLVLGIEKARCDTIGCPPERGLDVARAPKVVREQIRRTFHETPLARECLFVSHIAEFVPAAEPGSYSPTLLYDAYRAADPPEPDEVFEAGRRATLDLRGRLRAIAAERAAAGRPVAHIIVYITGWHTPQLRTLAHMDELHSSLVPTKPGDAACSPIFIGVSWPSFSDEIPAHVRKGTEVLALLKRRGRARDEGGDDEPDDGKRARAVGLAARAMEDRRVADKLGFLGYPAVSKDADEVGMVPVSTLVNQVLVPLRDELPGHPPVVVIGHSFGARAASWTPFTAKLLPEVPGVTDTAGPDLVLGLQAAFPAARFDPTVRHHRPYVEGPAFADHAPYRTLFAYTCAPDNHLLAARAFDVMIGDIRAFKRARDEAIPAFATCEAGDLLEGDVAPIPATEKVMLIDAHTIIKGHNDVRNERIGRLLRTLMARASTR